MTPPPSSCRVPDLDRLRPKGVSVQIIIPVFNEEGILEKQLAPVLDALPSGFSVFVVENGSTDRTAAILSEMEARHGALSHDSLPHPNYGLAMKHGLTEATGDVIIIDDLDVLDMDFWGRGLSILSDGGVDLVQGSKVLAGKGDARPLLRRAATLTLTFLLRTLLGFRGNRHARAQGDVPQCYGAGTARVYLRAGPVSNGACDKGSEDGHQDKGDTHTPKGDQGHAASTCKEGSKGRQGYSAAAPGTWRKVPHPSRIA